MFPYPSGALHMGHVRVYTISDCIARYHRMRGYAVVHPMGWDAFGLPAENAALQRGIPPAEWTARNIASMRRQLDSLSLSFDWSTRTVTTCSPSYYQHTQRLFLRLLHAGLVYRAHAYVNWDPVDHTVLANEQVDQTGRSWRSGAVVERRRLMQWWVRISEYREELLRGVDEGLPDWPAQVKQMQKHWIGRSEGHHVSFTLGPSSPSLASISSHLPAPAPPPLTVFTTRIDTIYGVTYLVVAPEHPLIDHSLTHHLLPPHHHSAVTDYRRRVGGMTDVQRRSNEGGKGGVWSGLTATHPLTGEQLKVMISEYVLPDYGTGAVMGVPAHDARDHAFAQLHSLPIIPVVAPPPSLSPNPSDVYTGDGLLVNSGPFTGQPNTSATPHILSLLSSAAHPATDYRLKDWLVSRQRYWGTPIPIIHCPSCGPTPVPDADLPVVLPPLDFTGLTGGNPLASPAARTWREVPCPRCGGQGERETDTLDTFVDSSWYFLRYLSPTSSLPFDPTEVAPYMPVHVYVGGIEHAILHLLYARFFTHFLHRQGLLPHPEPFRRLVTQGMVQGMTYKHPVTGQFISPSRVQRDAAGAYVQDEGQRVPLDVVWEKMSKSKMNGVEPASVIDRYGADTVRLFTLFKAPPEKSLNWDEEAIQGQVRWLNRMHALLTAHTSALPTSPPSSPFSPPSPPPLPSAALRVLRQAIPSTVSFVTSALSSHTFNVAIAQLMKLTNNLTDTARQHPQVVGSAVMQEGLEVLALMLAPMAPHFAAEMWEGLKASRTAERTEQEGDVHSQQWPGGEEDETGGKVGVVVMVNGKRLCVVEADEALLSDQGRVESLVRERAEVQSALQGATPHRVVYAHQREKGTAIVNFIV